MSDTSQNQFSTTYPGQQVPGAPDNDGGAAPTRPGHHGRDHIPATSPKSITSLSEVIDATTHQGHTLPSGENVCIRDDGSDPLISESEDAKSQKFGCHPGLPSLLLRGYAAAAFSVDEECPGATFEVQHLCNYIFVIKRYPYTYPRARWTSDNG